VLGTLKALAEPNRLPIVELLRAGPRPVADMVHRLRLRQPQVSKHLRVLSHAGLVEAPHRRPASHLQAAAAPWQQRDVWLKKCRQLWEQNFRRLDVLLDHLQAEESKSTRKR
jgi:DNA-binding transcriptional ArsR family regulator